MTYLKKVLAGSSWESYADRTNTDDFKGNTYWYFVDPDGDGASIKVETGNTPVKPGKKPQVEKKLKELCGTKAKVDWQHDNEFAISVDLGEVNLADNLDKNLLQKGYSQLEKLEQSIFGDKELRSLLDVY